MKIPRALTVAGSDSGGGAGVQADLKTFTAMSVFGSSVITALTAQNSYEVRGIWEVSPDFVKLQMDAVLQDIGCDAAKTGMLYSAEIVRTVHKEFTEFPVPYVVDPVMISKSGKRLLLLEAIEEMKSGLLADACLITPNIPEAEELSGIRITEESEIDAVAEKLAGEFGCAVLLKGGHSRGKESVDMLRMGNISKRYSSPRFITDNTHGTGDTLSAAITAGLAKGVNLVDSIEHAKEFIEGAIKNSFPAGKGFGSLNHFWQHY
ncbi:MAG: bifunctional hydroxymethylpyrimidine kinase/phosphomethylpyrimidine kinase [Candidatus Thermoplasmatota archaeon]|jgi:hydroxymethylpyrimidine/phosphomethylpyrimidine kinase|nr:bifunctional hydroxymethylpyrimidine kinase/phosphomethylpyrimidine kinase [Candidatus Thermoplasmatota archaeon]MCL5785189.1 bifunctional hydroxymethylpyrimidine kinase/phosphomethylpyrimidine kinase [Candidatus Thermoplasmatota archaeon]